jgi:hypothetical protein
MEPIHDERECNCGLVAKFAQAGPNSKNQGKWFYACPLSRDQQCNFFVWAEPERASKPPAVSRGVSKATPAQPAQKRVQQLRNDALAESVRKSVETAATDSLVLLISVTTELRETCAEIRDELKKQREGEPNIC